MIVLTVKTLDSQNHTFTVEDDITVEQFKARIADTVNIPAETQRIIYYGRVLQDSSKLSDYDVNGKVVHLVHRPPPSQNAPPRQPSPPRNARGFDAEHNVENTMYLGSMAVPSNLLDAHGVLPPPPTHTLAGSRLNVARRMLRRAEAVIALLENPSGPNDPPNPEEQQEEEVTPIIEARVIVPPENGDNVMFTTVPSNSLNADSRPAASGSTPEEPRASTGGENQATASGRNLPENVCRTSEMADLLTTLNQLQLRFAPFLERYRTFMAEDLVVTEGVRETQTMLTRISEVLHFLGHAYHSLSDIIVRARTLPPRALLCRPILIQHSALVHAGIPVQVEVAQINLAASANNAPSAPATEPTTGTETATTTSSSTAPSHHGPTINFGPFPLVQTGGMRMQTFPIEVRGGHRQIVLPRPLHNNNNNTVATSTTATTSTTPTSTTPTSATPTSATPTTVSSGPSSGNFNNSSMEFFMEFTPDALRNSLNLQSIVQMAGQIMNRMTTTPPSTETTTTAASSTAQSSTDSSPPQSQGGGQTSQARGNTATNLTTSTQTRSTPRPHVHLAQQAMQGGFDPFLPCNSHHITTRRRLMPGGIRQSGGERPSDAPEDYFIDELFASLRSAYNRRREGEEARTTTSQTSAASDEPRRGSGDGASGSQTQPSTPSIPPLLAALLPNLQSTLANLPSMLQGSTIADILQQFPFEEGQENPGESIITDLLMLLSRNLTIVDMITLNAGNFEPLNRVSGDLQNFIRTRVLEGASDLEGIERAVNKIVSEMLPFFENFRRLRVRDDIDIVESMQVLFRSRLRTIISIASDLSSGAQMRLLIEECVKLAKLMCSLAVRASAVGPQGVEDTFQYFISTYLQGIPADLQSWTTLRSCLNLRHFMSSLTITDAEIEVYVRRTTQPAPPEPEPEAMETEESAPEPELPPLSLGDDAEPLPNVVLGAEQWHGQVPEDWVPIITRDVQRQRRQNTQAPFSDGYLSAMPTKRRKIVNGNKPQGSLNQVIADSVRRAVTATGLTQTTPVDVVSQSAGQSPEIQSAYRNLLRTRVQSALRDNEDFTPERFPNASTYFKEP